MKKGKVDDSVSTVVTLVKRNKAKITQAWLKNLRKSWGGGMTRKAKAVSEECDGKRDLLSFLLSSMEKPDPPSGSPHQQILKKIRTLDFYISDFLHEAWSLDDTLDEEILRMKELDFSVRSQGAQVIRKKLRQIVQNVMSETTDVYEFALEQGGRGFCQMNKEGKILFANKEMNRIADEESIIGTKLTSFFKGDQQKFILDILTDEKNKRPRLRMLEFRRHDGKRVMVGAELAPLNIAKTREGCIGSFTDISMPLRAQNQIYDQSPVGIARLNTDWQFEYGNSYICESFGVEKIRGHNFREWLPDKESLDTVKKQLKRRFDQRFSSQYEVTITRPDGRKVPMEIAAMPDTDMQGNVVGSFGIIRDLTLDKTIEAIHEHVEELNDNKDMLTKVTQEVSSLVPFERLGITVFSSDMQHIRVLFSYSANGNPVFQIRYWKMPSYVKKWLTNRENRYIPDLKEFLNQTRWRALEQDKAVMELVESNLLSLYRYPVFSKGELVASVSFYRQGVDAFTPREMKNLERLPLNKAVTMALHMDRFKNLEFRLQLLKDILDHCEDLENVAKIIVDRLKEHYNWLDVGIYRVDKKNKLFKLVAERTERKGSDPLKRTSYTQGLDEGVLGWVYAKKKAINIPDIAEDPRFREIYVADVEGCHSELCIPVKVGSEIIWVLNVEDELPNAFSKDEVDDLMTVLREVGSILERAYLAHFRDATFSAASDALIVTDGRGRVLQVNPAVKQLLGYAEEEMVGKSLRKHFVSKAQYDRMLSGERVSGKEINLLKRNGKTVPVLISSSPLPDEMDGVVFVAKDLSTLKRLEELEYISRMYHELAVQTKTPLSLAFAWMKRAREKTGDESLSAMIEKTLSQLQKMKLSYDRLALYGQEEGLLPYNEVLLDAPEILNRVINGLPDAEGDKIKISLPSGLPAFRGDLYRLEFCVESILSYLLRFSPEEEDVVVEVSKIRNNITFKMRGFCPGTASDIRADSAGAAAFSETLADMALGGEVIERFIRQLGGIYHEPKKSGKRIEFRLDLPIKKGDIHAKSSRTRSVS